MSDPITFTIDGVEVTGTKGQTIIQAADEAGIYIPRLCHRPELVPRGSCRLCTVLVNGRPQSACTHPIAPGMIVQNDLEELFAMRKSIIEMLFVEGNHFCMFCEKSGNCELQAMGYRFGITTPRYPYLFPKREVDCTHPDVMIDRNRCIMCGRCVRASKDLDGKNVFGFINRGPKQRLAVNAEANLSDTALDILDRAVTICPVGSLLTKRVGYVVPIGRRLYDHTPIGTDIETKRAGEAQ